MEAQTVDRVGYCDSCDGIKSSYNPHSCDAHRLWLHRRGLLQRALTDTGISIGFFAPGEWSRVALDPVLSADVANQATENAAFARLRIMRLSLSHEAWLAWDGGEPLVDVMRRLPASVEYASHPEDSRGWDALSALP